jgi:hypothetical protein
MAGLNFQIGKCYLSDLNNIAMVNRRSTKTGCMIIQRSPAQMGIRVPIGTIYWERSEVNIAQQDLTINAADLLYSRIDLIALDMSGTASVIVGTPADSPHTPVYDPEAYVILARVLVPALATSIVTANITDLRIINEAFLPGVMTYLHVQGSSATTWSVTHNLDDSNPVVFVFDVSGNPIEPESITITGANTLTIAFGSVTAGKARIVGGTAGVVGGGGGGALRYLHTQAAPGATWSVPHNLGEKYVSVTVFDTGDSVVIPDSIALVDSNNLTIGFGTPVAGKALILG